MNLNRVTVSRLPRHVAVIMDGNGRWAQQRGSLRPVGHEEGSNTVRRIVRFCRRLGIPALTLYAFSEQNWARPAAEVQALMLLLREFLIQEREEILDNGIRLRAIGRTDKLPAEVLSVLRPLEAETLQNDGMTLTLALSYGGREELVDACQGLVSKGEALTEESLARHLPSMEVGPVDLLIRTGGEVRISNFLLWGAAYAELYFTECLWPDFDEDELVRALQSFESRDRRFGKVHQNVKLSRGA